MTLIVIIIFLILGMAIAVVLQPEGLGFDPSLTQQHAEVSLGKILNPEFPLIDKEVNWWMGEWQKSVLSSTLSGHQD